MKTVIKIDFREDDNYFEDEWDENIDPNLLIIALLETVNDICEANKLNTKERLERYIELGSMDNWDKEGV